MRHSNRILSLDEIQQRAPSVFATEAWGQTSENYRFIPTVDVVNGLIANGFVPVDARQSRTRIEGKQDFTKHLLRFRHRDQFDENREVKVGDGIPEIVLLNSHDRSSSYQISLGIFRLVCTNGMIVKSAGVDEIRVRHSGGEDIVQQVIEGSYRIIEDAPKAIAQIEQWKGIQLDEHEQGILAEAALEVRDTSLDISVESLLSARRYQDSGTNGSRDLWRTMNVVQENLIRGGVVGRDANNQRRRLRGVKSVDGDTKLNRALWQLSEKMAEYKGVAA